MIKANRGGPAHLAELALREEYPLGNRRGGAGCFKRSIRAASEESLSAMLTQVFTGCVEVTQLRWMFDAAHVNPALAKLLSIERRTFRGQSQGPPEARALHRFDRPGRRQVQESNGALRLHVQHHPFDMFD